MTILFTSASQRLRTVVFLKEFSSKGIKFQELLEKELTIGQISILESTLIFTHESIEFILAISSLVNSLSKMNSLLTLQSKFLMTIFCILE